MLIRDQRNQHVFVVSSSESLTSSERRGEIDIPLTELGEKAKKELRSKADVKFP